MPAVISLAIISSESEEGPIVQTIFVRRFISSRSDGGSTARASTSLQAHPNECAAPLPLPQSLLLYAPFFRRRKRAACMHQKNADRLRARGSNYQPHCRFRLGPNRFFLFRQRLSSSRD